MTYKCHFRGTIREKPGTSAALWICICYSLLKFSRSRAALWLAMSECSFYDGRSPSWRGHGNGKSQLAECATEIAMNEKRFVPRRPISHVAAVLFGSRPLQRKRLQRPSLSASGIKCDFTGARSAAAFTTDTAMEEEAT